MRVPFWTILTFRQIRLVPDEDPAPQVVNDTEIEYLKSIVPFAQSSYCIQGLTEWKCKTCTFQGTRNISLFGDYEHDSFGYVAVSDNLQRIVIAFRGTRNLRNWIQDLQFAKPDVPFPEAPDGAAVHYGFLHAYLSMREDIVRLAAVHLVENPGYKLLITGHSLGGAVSTICAMDLRTAFPHVEMQVFSLNAPRVGNDAFQGWYNSEIPDSIRVVNQDDLTPHLPPRWSDFVHVQTEYWITPDETLKCVSKQENKDCSSSQRLFNWLKHLEVWGLPIGLHACF